MNMVDIILKKKAGGALSAEEIRFFAQRRGGRLDPGLPAFRAADGDLLAAA